MKKVLVPLVLLALLITGGSSCKKIVDKIFKGIDAKAPDFTVTIPAVPFVVSQELPGPEVNAAFNLDSIVRATSGGLFGLDDVKSIKIKSISINVPDADANNNLSNFERTRVTLYSNTNTTPVDLATINFPDLPMQMSITETPTNSPELLSYFKGSRITYRSYGKMRRTTSKELTFVIAVTMRVQ